MTAPAHDDSAALVRMANQIAAAFRSQPGAEAGIADHLRQFWTRGMRERLRGLAVEGEAPLDPLVLQALG